MISQTLHVKNMLFIVFIPNPIIPIVYLLIILLTYYFLLDKILEMNTEFT